MGAVADFLISEQLSQMGIVPIVLTGIVSLFVAVVANKINGTPKESINNTTISNSFNNNVMNNTNVYVVNRGNSDEAVVAFCILGLLFWGYVKYAAHRINEAPIPELLEIESNLARGCKIFCVIG